MANNGVTFIRKTDPLRTELPNTIIDDWANWVSTVTDAPTQYHRATGAVILSTIMTPYISLPTSYGSIIPNIWMMVLAGTTLTRKSTSMDLAILMLNDVMDDFLLATDGSPEGLLTELSFRDGKVSVFHRDEITGFMSQVGGREYMSGLLESLTRLYDGKSEKRILRKESIEIRKPYLIFMAGGIKSRMEELVGMDHIRSGFLPRFLFVSGSTTAEQMRPIGPPAPAERKRDGTAPRDRILDQLWRIHKFYTETGQSETKVTIGGITKLSTPMSKHVEMEATPEAWDRIRQMKADAVVLGEKSSAPELYTPIYDRLSNTVIKVAMLLAGAELKSTVEYIHVCKAISLAQEWIESVTDFAANIEAQPDMDKWERKAQKIVAWVKNRHPEPVSQTEIMQKFRIRKRDIDDIEATMVARNWVKIDPYPHRRDRSGGQIHYTLPEGFTMAKVTPKDPIQREDTFLAAPERYAENGRGHVEDRYFYDPDNDDIKAEKTIRG